MIKELELERDRLPVVVTFFTHLRYKKCAEELLASAARLNIEIYLEERKQLETHKLNLHQKIPFIREMLTKFRPRPVLWVDSDAVIRRWPAVLDRSTWPGWELPFDCAFARADILDRIDMVMGGTLFFANTSAARMLLDSWEHETLLTPRLYDFENLSRALVVVQNHVQVEQLAPTYCWVERWFRDKMPDESPVIEHFAISQV